MKKGHSVVHNESVDVLRACRGLSGLVGACRGLSGLVGTSRDFSGLLGNVDFMESHFEGIAVVVHKISAEFPIPEILRSVPVAPAPWASWAPGCTGAMYASPARAK